MKEKNLKEIKTNKNRREIKNHLLSFFLFKQITTELFIISFITQ
jgi:hypothetical protein